MKRISLVSAFLSILFIAACGKDESKSTNSQNSAIAVLSVSNMPRFDFGLQMVDSTVEHEFVVTNIGSVAATQVTGSFYLSQSFNYKGGNFPGEGGTCETILSAHEECTVIVVFTPKYAGAVNTTLTINYNNGAGEAIATGPTLTGQGN